jgi:hypothetical protein
MKLCVTLFANLEVIFCLNSSKMQIAFYKKWLTFKTCRRYRVSDSAFSFSQKSKNQCTLMHILALRPSESGMDWSKIKP